MKPDLNDPTFWTFGGVRPTRTIDPRWRPEPSLSTRVSRGLAFVIINLAALYIGAHVLVAAGVACP